MLNGELLEMRHEIYIQSDPARMCKVMGQTAKTCFTFKILTAGRIGDEGGTRVFRTAFDWIEPYDGVYRGMSQNRKDEMKENAEIVYCILSSGKL